MTTIRPIVVNKDHVILGGNMRYRAMQLAGWKEVPVEVVDLTPEQEREFIIKDNVSGGEWDYEMLLDDWDIADLEDWGLDLPSNNLTPEGANGVLQERFVIAPFSVLDSRQGVWLDRKRAWHSLILDKGESRENALGEGLNAINNGVSILDPVLAELINRWFTIPNSNTFDTFAGDSVFGYVSNALGHNFTGIELRQEQADYNNARLKDGNSKYICDDGQNVLKHVKPKSQDLLFSCPPYFDLEVYSDLPNDASNQDDYNEFKIIIDNAFTDAITCLKDDRFAVIVAGDVRDKKGMYYGFVDDIKDIFKRNGMGLYNELILVESLGTLPQRVGNYMKHRKVGKCHQNVLVFYKGDTKAIKNNYPELKGIDESTDVQLPDMA